MFYISGESNGIFESKGSKFISFLFEYESLSNKIDCLKKEHPKARHIVSASRFFDEYGHICESFDDDGEPKGSSGMPLLNVLRGENLINCGVATIRYFGGTLLGVGGLVRAYTKSLQDAILNARELNILAPYEFLVDGEFFVSYSDCGKMEYTLRDLEHKKDFLQDGVLFKVRCNEKKMTDIQNFYHSKMGY